MTYGDPYEMMYELEDELCRTCTFRKDDDADYPMCYEVEGLVLVDESVVWPLVMRPDGIVTCTKYKSGPPLAPLDPDQLTLVDSQDIHRDSD